MRSSIGPTWSDWKLYGVPLRLAGAVACACLAVFACSPEELPPPLEPSLLPDGRLTYDRVGVEKRTGAIIPLDLTFTDTTNRKVVLRDIVDRPTIFNFIFYRCTGICAPTMGALTEVLEKMAEPPGNYYRVVTVSFDPTEGYHDAAEKKRVYMDESPKQFAEGSWWWLFGGAEEIKKLTQSVGFYFKSNQDDLGQYLHGSALVLVDSEGMVTHYIYTNQDYFDGNADGITGGTGKLSVAFSDQMGQYMRTDFSVSELTLALRQASDSVIGSTVARALQFCYSREPNAHGPVFQLLPVVATGILAVLLAFLIYLVVTSRRRRTKLQEHGKG